MEVNGEVIQYLKYEIECDIDANCNVKVLQTESKNASQIVHDNCTIPSMLGKVISTHLSCGIGRRRI
jgi:hypothetical protein